MEAFYALALTGLLHYLSLTKFLVGNCDGIVSGCGVQFSNVTPEIKGQIEVFIRSLRKEPLLDFHSMV